MLDLLIWNLASETSRKHRVAMEAHFEEPLKRAEKVLQGSTWIIRIPAETGWEEEVLQPSTPRVHEWPNAMRISFAAPDRFEYL